MSLTALRKGGPHQAREQAGAGRPWRSRAGARWAGTEGDGQSQLMAKSAPGGRGSRPPAPTTGLRNERQKLQPLHLTLAFSLQVGALMGLICVDSVCSKRTAVRIPDVTARSKAAGPWRPHAPRRCQRGGGVRHRGQQGRHHVVGPQREETGLLDLDGEPLSLGTGGEDGPEAVVALHAITTPGTAT